MENRSHPLIPFFKDGFVRIAVNIETGHFSRANVGLLLKMYSLHPKEKDSEAYQGIVERIKHYQNNPSELNKTILSELLMDVERFIEESGYLMDSTYRMLSQLDKCPEGRR